MATRMAKAARKTAKKKSAKRPVRKLTRAALLDLYAARRYLGLATLKETGLRMPVEVYFKDPDVAEDFKACGHRQRIHHALGARPSRRPDQRALRRRRLRFDQQHADTSRGLGPKGELLSRTRRQQSSTETTKELFQYHQLSVWATVQNTLEFFESGFGLGRRISWAFEGNRLIVVPHAGYGENAYYDRASKSLQLLLVRWRRRDASSLASRPTS